VDVQVLNNQQLLQPADLDLEPSQAQQLDNSDMMQQQGVVEWLMVELVWLAEWLADMMLDMEHCMVDRH